MTESWKYTRSREPNGGALVEAKPHAAFLPRSLGVGNLVFPYTSTATAPDIQREVIEIVRFPTMAEMTREVTTARAKQHMHTAVAFAANAYRIPGVLEVRVTSGGQGDRELVVTALTEERDMERDLQLQRLFRDVAPDTLRWSLRVRLAAEDATRAEHGTLLPRF